MILTSKRKQSFEMMMTTVFYYPKWFKDFRCGGHGCCCKFWEIKLTSYDYLKLKSAVSGTILEARFHSYIIVDKDVSPSDSAHHPPRNHLESTSYDAHMLMTERVYCPFLDSDMHCSIQRVLGKSYLPSVCVNFPMKSRLTIDGILVTPEILCPVIRDKMHDATDGFSIFFEEREFFRDVIYGPQDMVIQSVPLSRGVNLTWDQYRKLRGVMIAALDQIEGPILYRLAVVQTMLSEIWSKTHSHAPFEDMLLELQDTHEGIMSIHADTAAALESVLLIEKRFQYYQYLERTAELPTADEIMTELDPYEAFEKSIPDAFSDHQNMRIHLQDWRNAMNRYVTNEERGLTPMIIRYLQVKLFSMGLDGTIREDMDRMGTVVAQALRYTSAFAAVLGVPATSRLMSMALGFAEFRLRSDKTRVQAFHPNAAFITMRKLENEGSFEEMTSPSLSISRK